MNDVGVRVVQVLLPRLVLPKERVGRVLRHRADLAAEPGRLLVHQPDRRVGRRERRLRREPEEGAEEQRHRGRTMSAQQPVFQ